MIPLPSISIELLIETMICTLPLHTVSEVMSVIAPYIDYHSHIENIEIDVESQVYNTTLECEVITCKL